MFQPETTEVRLAVKCLTVELYRLKISDAYYFGWVSPAS